MCITHCALSCHCTQLNELESAVSVAAADPERFNLTSEELESRRRWIESIRRQVRSCVRVCVCMFTCTQLAHFMLLALVRTPISPHSMPPFLFTDLQIDGTKERLKAALATPVPTAKQSQYTAANQNFLGSESESQQLLMRCVSP